MKYKIYEYVQGDKLKYFIMSADGRAITSKNTNYLSYSSLPKLVADIIEGILERNLDDSVLSVYFMSTTKARTEIFELEDLEDIGQIKMKFPEHFI